MTERLDFTFLFLCSLPLLSNPVPIINSESQYKSTISVCICALLFFMSTLALDSIKNTILDEVAYDLRKLLYLAEVSPKALKNLKKKLLDPVNDEEFFTMLARQEAINLIKISFLLMSSIILHVNYLSVNYLLKNLMTYCNKGHAVEICEEELHYLSLSEMYLDLFTFINICLMSFSLTPFIASKISEYLFNRSKIVCRIFGPPCYSEDLDWLCSLSPTGWKVLLLASHCCPEEVFKGYIHALAKPPVVSIEKY